MPCLHGPVSFAGVDRSCGRNGGVRTDGDTVPRSKAGDHHSDADCCPYRYPYSRLRSDSCTEADEHAGSHPYAEDNEHAGIHPDAEAD